MSCLKIVKNWSHDKKIIFFYREDLLSPKKFKKILFFKFLKKGKGSLFKKLGVFCQTLYRDKDVVEKSFDDLKNQLDMKRLRMHSSRATDGRLLVQFIALILMSGLRKEMREAQLTKRYTVRELLKEMETLTKITYSGRYGHILTEVTKPQREILKKLKIVSDEQA